MKTDRLLLGSPLITVLILAACSPAISTPDARAATPSVTATTAPTSASEITQTPTEEAFLMPEGRLLVYTSLGEDGGEYSQVNLADLSVEAYEPLNSEEWFVDWTWDLSPDSRYLAYSRSINQDYAFDSLYLFDFRTGISTEILSGYASNGRPSWTADGTLLAFDNYDQGLYIYEVETGNTRHISVSSEFSDQAAISPSGDRIAYKGGCPGLGIACPVDLYLINTDGSGERALLEGAMLDWIFWRADGRVIYFSMFGDPDSYGNTGSGYKLYALDVETGEASPVADPQFNTAAYGSSFLSPNGEFLAYNFGDAGLQIIRTSDNSDIAFLPSGYLTWSPDSRYILISSWDAAGEYELFDMQTGQSILIETEIPAGSQIVGWLP